MLRILTTPFGFFLFMGFAAVLLRWMSRTPGEDFRSRAAFRLLAAAWFGLCLLATPLAADLLAGVLERRAETWPPPPRWSQAPDVIVVFAGGMEGQKVEGGALSRASQERLITALAALRRWPDARLLVSGGQPSPGAVTAAGLMADQAVRLGVDPLRIIVEDRARNTWENALETRNILEREGLKRPALVTSAVHMLRSRAALRRVGIPSRPVASPAPARLTWNVGDLLPGARALDRSTSAVHEMLGLVWYWSRGRLALTSDPRPSGAVSPASLRSGSERSILRAS